MNKQEFLAKLRDGLSGIPKEDVEERVAFYNEMIEDRIEDGLSEEEAVSSIGDVDAVVKQIIADIPLSKLAKKRIRPEKGLKTWEIILLILGFPLWFPLCVAAFAVVLSIYIVLWAVIVSFWAVFVSFAACFLGGIISGTVLAFSGYGLTGTAVIGVGIACAGLSIFSFYICKAASKGALMLTKKITVQVKKSFIKKEKTYA